jgi:NAD(P)-dependent dehydrogenase (short-subunit alcohol dehydrogenase family)
VRSAGLPSQTDLDAMREVYETNVFGVIIVTNAMLPLLRRAPARGSSTCRARWARSLR